MRVADKEFDCYKYLDLAHLEKKIVGGKQRDMFFEKKKHGYFRSKVTTKAAEAARRSTWLMTDGTASATRYFTAGHPPLVTAQTATARL